MGFLRKHQDWPGDTPGKNLHHQNLGPRTSSRLQRLKISHTLQVEDNANGRRLCIPQKTSGGLWLVSYAAPEVGGRGLLADGFIPLHCLCSCIGSQTQHWLLRIYWQEGRLCAGTAIGCSYLTQLHVFRGCLSQAPSYLAGSAAFDRVTAAISWCRHLRCARLCKLYCLCCITDEWMPLHCYIFLVSAYAVLCWVVWMLFIKQASAANIWQRPCQFLHSDCICRYVMRIIGVSEKGLTVKACTLFILQFMNTKWLHIRGRKFKSWNIVRRFDCMTGVLFTGWRGYGRQRLTMFQLLMWWGKNFLPLRWLLGPVT